VPGEREIAIYGAWQIWEHHGKSPTTVYGRDNHLTSSNEFWGIFQHAMEMIGGHVWPMFIIPVGLPHLDLKIS
jgi:hypothetical protein